MSREKEIDNAIRWLEQAKADIRAAEISRNGGSYEWACFQSQQAGEKILKAYWYHRSLDPWGHSLVKLLNEIPGDRRDFDIAGLMDLGGRGGGGGLRRAWGGWARGGCGRGFSCAGLFHR